MVYWSYKTSQRGDVSMLTIGNLPKDVREYYDELKGLINSLKDFKGTRDEHQEIIKEINTRTSQIISLSISSLIFSGLSGSKHGGNDGDVDALFANILHGVTVKVTTEVPAAMAVGVEQLGVTMFVNPFHLVALAVDIHQVMAIIRHECYHLVFKHLTVYSAYINRQHIRRTLSNLATDCEINQIVTGLPGGTVTVEMLEKMVGHPLQKRAGTLYYLEQLEASDFLKQLEEQRDQLMQQLKQQAKEKMEGSSDSQSGQGTPSQDGNQSDEDSQDQGNQEGTIDMSGDVLRDAFGGLRQEELEALFGTVNGHNTWENSEQEGGESIVEGVLGDLVKGAYNKLNDKQRGNLPGNITEAIQAYSKERSINWKSMVRKGFGSIPVPFKQTKKRVNRRQPHRPELRGRMTDRQVEVVVFIDTSGSMSNTEISYVLGEVQNMIKDIRATVEVVLVDTKVNAVYNNLRDVSNVSIKGRGGTNFDPAFQYLHQTGKTNRNTLAVYFTDGWGETEDKINRHGFDNIYWVLTGENAGLDDLSCEGKGRVALLKDDAKLNRKKIGSK